MAIEDKSAAPVSTYGAQTGLDPKLDKCRADKCQTKCRAAHTDLLIIRDDNLMKEHAASMNRLQLDCKFTYIEAGRAIEEKTETKEGSKISSLDLKMER